jgi:hypothetical protein
LNPRNDLILGRLLILIGAISALAIAAFFVLSHESIPISMLIIPELSVMIGLAILFFDFVDEELNLKDEIENFPQLIEDDIEDLKKGKFTSTHAMVIITTVTLVAQIAIIFLYRKWQAIWMGAINVVFVAGLVGLVTVIVGVKSKWFQNRRRRLSWGIFLIPFMFYGISAFLGIFFMEPKIGSARGFPINQGSTYRYASAETRSNQLNLLDTVSIGDGGINVDCDDEGCLVIILVIIGILCVIASAVIPHFWVVATTILWVIMALVAMRELLYNEALQAKKA